MCKDAVSSDIMTQHQGRRRREVREAYKVIPFQFFEFGYRCAVDLKGSQPYLDSLFANLARFGEAC